MTIDKQSASSNRTTAAQAAATQALETLDAAAYQAALTENPLSEREMDVARLLVTGASNAEIAQQLVISPHTVKVHLRNIFDKLQVTSRMEASMLLVQRGWLAMPGMVVTINSPTANSLTAPAAVVVNGDLANELTLLPEVQAVVVPPLPADPPPLHDSMMIVRPWQRALLVAVACMAFLSVVLPLWFGQGEMGGSLFSDANLAGGSAANLQQLPNWKFLEPLPQPRSRLALASEQGLLYAIGGESKTGVILDRVDVYDLAQNAWGSRANLPTPLSNCSATTLNGYIYVAGGISSAADDASPIIHGDLLRYAPAQNRWERLSALPIPLAGTVLLADAQSLYLVGGWDGERMYDEIWRFTPKVSDSTPTTNTATLVGENAEGAAEWQVVTRLPSPRAFLGATLAGGKLYIAGGSANQARLAQVASYDLAKNVWEELPPLSTPRSALSLVYDGQKLYAMGGDTESNSTQHESFDLANKTWSNQPSPVLGEWRHLAVVVEQNERLHLVGGWSGGYMNTNAELRTRSRVFLPVISNEP